MIELHVAKTSEPFIVLMFSFYIIIHLERPKWLVTPLLPVTSELLAPKSKFHEIYYSNLRLSLNLNDP